MTCEVPLPLFRLDRLDHAEKRVLEQDLGLAIQAQQCMLPEQRLSCKGWCISYLYDPASLVGGDCCDVIDAGVNGVYFIIGDICGKGVAASLLMAHLLGVLRGLISMGLPVKVIMERANMILSASRFPMHYATLVCGQARADGMVEISNGGHPYPLLVHDGNVTVLQESGAPVGMFCDEKFSVMRMRLKPGQRMVLYSDGVSEARDVWGVEYGAHRLLKLIAHEQTGDVSAVLSACQKDLAGFRRGAEKADDVTMLVLGRELSPNS